MLITTTTAARTAFEGQGEIAPGTQGYWKVWGARPCDIRTGDLIMTKDGDDVRYDLILDRFAAKAAPIRQGLVNAEGEQFTLGALTPVIVLRPGTHHTLA